MYIYDFISYERKYAGLSFKELEYFLEKMETVDSMTMRVIEIARDEDEYGNFEGTYTLKVGIQIGCGIWNDKEKGNERIVNRFEEFLEEMRNTLESTLEP